MREAGDLETLQPAPCVCGRGCLQGKDEGESSWVASSWDPVGGGERKTEQWERGRELYGWGTEKEKKKTDSRHDGEIRKKEKA